MSEQKRLKQLVAQGKLREVFKAIEEAFPVSSAENNTRIINEVKYLQAEDAKKRGTINNEDYIIALAQVTESVVELIDALPDEASGPTEGRPLQDYHRLTCDRVDQSDIFNSFFEAQVDRKSHFFYIYGMEKQSHEGLFNRFAFDLEGKLQDYLSDTGTDATCQALKTAITFDESRNEEGYKRNVLKSLFGALSVTVDEQAPLLDRRLTDLALNSPQIKGLGPNDYACIFLSISEFDWDPDITPMVVQWFITTFCAVDLPATSPIFLFFFGLIYEDDDGEIEAEVQRAIKEGRHIKILPELNMVSQRDIKKWLAKYKGKLDLSTDGRDAIIAEYFEDKDEFYMEKVERILAQIIIKHNKRFYT